METPIKRHPLLTPAMYRVLRYMVDEQEELVGDNGQWWVGLHRTSWKTVQKLLTYCLIRGPDDTGGAERYSACEDTYGVLKDRDYVISLFRARSVAPPVKSLSKLDFQGRKRLRRIHSKIASNGLRESDSSIQEWLDHEGIKPLDLIRLILKLSGKEV